MIHAGISELQKAFRHHKNSSEDCTASSSSYLLLFYAVECGLKSVYLHGKRLNITDDISDTVLHQSHDLSKWAKALRLPVSMTNVHTTFHLKRDRHPRPSWQIARAHEAWRYGVVIDKNDETRLVNWLKQIAQWIEENIRYAS